VSSPSGTWTDSEISGALDGALDRGELFAVFQPQIALDTGGVAAAEALCRWTHPLRGPVPPDVFIPLAERTGAIHAVGHFMLERALEAASAWQRSGDPVSVSVNVSPVQLQTDSFVLDLAGSLGRSAVDAGRLTIEMTETHPVVGLPDVVIRLETIREMGVHVSLDDYGVGHASADQLARLPVDEVKLERSLLDGNNLEASDIVLHVTTEARRRGLRVVAEGVETHEQLKFVTDIGCERAQGFLLGRPMDVAALGELIRRTT
jgi:EAL domain-containing protein (putative c-di-GMP-specific phosphodiesterase class I)